MASSPSNCNSSSDGGGTGGSNNREVYDCIVVGLGAHGSCAVAQLAKHGAYVLGLEQFEEWTHSNGSSHGKSRIIRRSYFESPKYVPLVQRSFALWREYQEEYVKLLRERNPSSSPGDSNCCDEVLDKEPLLVMSGGLVIGKKSSVIVQGTLKSAREHKLAHEVLSASEIRQRYGGVFDVTTQDIGVFEKEAGYLIPETCISAHIQLAEKYGAEIHHGERMLSYEQVENHPSGKSLVRVKTDKGCYLAEKVVLSIGPWAPETYGHVIPKEIDFHCERRVLWWLDPLNSEACRKRLASVGGSANTSKSNARDSIHTGNSQYYVPIPTSPLIHRALSFLWRGVHGLFGWLGWFFSLGKWPLLTSEDGKENEKVQEESRRIMDTLARLPVFIWATGDDRNFYGFPFKSSKSDSTNTPSEDSAGVGMKLAMHLPEDVRCVRETIERDILPTDVEGMRSMVSKYVPMLDGPVVTTATCMYTRVSDGHFLIDWLPGEKKNVLMCSPCSGHGFKFASVVGEIVQQLVQQGKTVHDISLFTLENRKNK